MANQTKKEQKSQRKPVPETVKELQEKKPEQKGTGIAEDKQETESDKETSGEAKKNQDEAVETAELKPCEFAVPEEKPKPVLKLANDFISDHKIILGLFVTIGTIIISTLFYIYRKGYLSYFNVGNEWNDYTDKSLFYTLALPFCGAVILIAVLLTVMLPVIMKIRRLWKIIYLSVLHSACFIQLSLLFGSWTEKIQIIGILLLFILIVVTYFFTLSRDQDSCTKGETETELDYALLYPFLIPLIVCLTIGVIYYYWKTAHANLEIEKLKGIYYFFLIMSLYHISIFKLVFSLRQKTKMHLSPTESVLVFSISFLVSVSFLIVGIYQDGKNKAEKQTAVSIICDSSADDENADASVDETIRKINYILTDSTDPDDAIVVDVILAEKDNLYLVTKGTLGSDRVLHLDTNYHEILDKKKQVILHKPVDRIQKDYTYIPTEKEEKKP